MNKRQKLVAMLLAKSFLCAFTPALAQHKASVMTVEVFANSATHVQAPQGSPYLVRIYRLDAMQNVADQLSSHLPNNEADARAYMLQQEGQIRRRYKDQITNAANGMSLAIHYRLDRLPAVVINQNAVIYGEPDIGRAVALYLQSKGAR